VSFPQGLRSGRVGPRDIAWFFGTASAEHLVTVAGLRVAPAKSYLPLVPGVMKCGSDSAPRLRLSCSTNRCTLAPRDFSTQVRSDKIRMMSTDFQSAVRLCSGTFILVIIGAVMLATSSCDSALPEPSIATPTADTLTACEVAQEAQQAVTDVSNGASTAVAEIEQVFSDATDLADSVESTNEHELVDATSLWQDVESLNGEGSASSTGQLQDPVGLGKLTADADALMMDGKC